MPSAPQLTAIGTFQLSQNWFSSAGDLCRQGDLNHGTATIATGLLMLNKALLAELTQMSQDIAVLKAEVASLKPKPGLHSSSHPYIGIYRSSIAPADVVDRSTLIIEIL